MTVEISSFVQKDAKRFKVKVGVFLFLVQDEEILLLRRFNTGIADGLYVVPMGGLKEGEMVTEALIREAKEETDIVLKPEDVEVCHVMHRLHHMPESYSFPQIDIFFKASIYEGVVKNMEPDKCDELKFYPIKHLPQNTEPFICQAIEGMLHRQFFSEIGWDKR